MHRVHAESQVLAREEPAESPARWPERILELSRDWRCRRDASDRDRALGDLWTLVNVVLQRYARVYALRFGAIDREDIRDLAADKTLDLLRRMEEGSWDPASSSPAEIGGFLAGVARHGVIDLMRSRSRELRWWRDSRGAVAAGVPDPEETDSAEHALAIVECSGRLTSKARRVWFLRIFHDLPSVDIARHPGVGGTAAAVDAMLLRCRKLMRACMRTRGFDPGRIPVGAFTLLWQALEKEREAPRR